MRLHVLGSKERESRLKPTIFLQLWLLVIAIAAAVSSNGMEHTHNETRRLVVVLGTVLYPQL